MVWRTQGHELDHYSVPQDNQCVVIFTERIKWELRHHYTGKENFISKHLQVSSVVLEKEK